MDQMEVYKPGRLFTLDEANALLPRVSDLLELIQAKAQQLGELHAQLEDFRERKRAGDHSESESGLVQQVLGEANGISADLKAAMEDLLSLGCELKDVRTGLVDFPALRDERTVYLCWRQGEDAIRFWHELDTGFAGRQPL